MAESLQVTAEPNLEALERLLELQREGTGQRMALPWGVYLGSNGLLLKVSSLGGKDKELFRSLVVLNAGEWHIAQGYIYAVRSRGGHLQDCLGLLPNLHFLSLS